MQLNLHENQAEFARLRFTNTSSANWWDFAAQPNTATTTSYATLFYSALGRNVITFRGGNPDEGRHWDRSSPPEARRSDYADALREYLKFAERYAPADVISKVRKDVARKLKG